MTVIILGGMLAVVFGLATGGKHEACGGQCGPPYQAQVVFRPGTSAGTAAAAMSACAWKPFVVRAGRVDRFRGPRGAAPPGALTATVYTESMASHDSVRLLACLRRSHAVISAGYPD